MLIPLTRQTIDNLIPPLATGAQYLYAWGKVSDLLRRILISVVGAFMAIILSLFFGDGFQLPLLTIGIVFISYWLWAPILTASLRNFGCRKYRYGGFWRGEVLDVFLTEDLVGTQETVNRHGELVVVENRERRLNLEVGDETGFSTQVRVPLQKDHQGICVGDVVEMVVLSKLEDLGRIAQHTDLYVPTSDTWVSDYPYLQRDAFIQVSRQLETRWQLGHTGDRRRRQPPDYRQPRSPSDLRSRRYEPDWDEANDREFYRDEMEPEPFQDYPEAPRPRRRNPRGAIRPPRRRSNL